MNAKKKAEKIAEAFALSFLDDHLRHDLFIGSHIERILADYVQVIYQYVEDEAYFGAAITNQNGEQFVALNTFHPLRTRYFTAAHELWHLTEGSFMQGELFDHERAADRFAAAVMMPNALTKSLWQTFKKQYSQEEAIFYIADLAAVPYVAVVRRLRELGEAAPHVKWEESEWLARRHDLGFPPSALDSASKNQRFLAYEHVVKEAVNQKGMDPLTAANKLSVFSPEQAEAYQQQVINQANEHDA